MNTIKLNGSELTITDVINIAFHGYKVEIDEAAKDGIIKSRKIVDDIVNNNKIAYGINTGFGKFSNVTISKDECKDLQRKLILSHACSTGNNFPKEIVRSVMLLRANALSKGYSGIRLCVIETLLEMLNKGVHPIIREKGSLGASGDLSPLAHMVLPMLGEGEAEFNGEVLPGKIAMERAGIAIVELTSKEGLALINGTQVMTGAGVIALYNSINLLKLSDIAAALSLEALRGIRTAFDPRVQNVRPHAGQAVTAENILSLIDGSTFVTDQGEIRTQDAYTLRCVPQVHGASKDAVNYVKRTVDIEMNSATDNPLIFDNGDVISGGNFHGQPIALSFDFLGIAVAEIANISERRLERLINSNLNDLPAFLAKNGGLNSGFMITQYSAAALVSENKVLAHPACVDSIPSSANQEDHVSMGSISVNKSLEIVNNVRRVLATEIMAACQAIDFREGLKLGVGTAEAYRLVREHVAFIEEDTIMYKEIDKCEELLKDGTLLDGVEKIVKLNI
ncbi:histidine ammonia-lyase [Clostridium acidisoli DSM 12555]|uniref:Histidine ammonia-lyase n=1 Tax=Clostridium acidisoli DSM 12555 TaxID=1121291 RepID=A0A1W1XFP9_9CLOT|nr:histidine ammonia-lyase [Clostridium acidisoli]SMC22632.1 histidine ammonia-lyase [Clostridium acidisoli DSM 12555]